MPKERAEKKGLEKARHAPLARQLARDEKESAGRLRPVRREGRNDDSDDDDDGTKFLDAKMTKRIMKQATHCVPWPGVSDDVDSLEVLGAGGGAAQEVRLQRGRNA